MKENARLTVDMTQEEHTCLKMASTHLSLSMREFILLATFNQIKNLEDPWFTEQAGKTLKRFASPKRFSDSAET